MKPLSCQALAKVCGVTPRTVRNWMAEGLPRAKKGTRNTFDCSKVASWLLTHEKREALSRLQGYVASMDPGTPKPPKPDAEAEKYARKIARQSKAAATVVPAATDAAPWNIFRVRDTTARLYAEAMQMYVAAPPAEKVVHQKNVNASADIMRKLEIDCITVAKEMSLVMLVADAARIIGTATARVKHDLLTLPETVAADLAALDDERAVAALLTERITDVLRHLSAALQKLGG